MYAIVEVGGKQYKVKEKDIIEVERQVGKENMDIDLNKVLLIAEDKKKFEVGRPFLREAKVIATILKQLKAKKVFSYKYRRRKSSHWKKGHRQQLTRLLIKEIKLG